MLMKPRLVVKAALCREVAIPIFILACIVSGTAGIDNARAAPIVDRQVSITSDRAKQILAVAEAEAKTHSLNICIAVVDTNGDLVHFLRMDGSPINSVTLSQRKASTAARYQRPTQTLFDAYGTGPRLTRIIAAVSNLDPALVVLPGGFPLVEGGKLIGAIGCSGGTADQDTQICKAVVDMIK
jgi:glc operon protein GlcG